MFNILCIQKEDGKEIQFFPPLRKVEPNQDLEKVQRSWHS